MSVRAYKIKEIDHEKNPTFNCWSDEMQSIFHLANTDNYDDGGILYFEREVLEDELAQIKHPSKEVKEVHKLIEKILEDMGQDNEIQYYCY